MGHCRQAGQALIPPGACMCSARRVHASLTASASRGRERRRVSICMPGAPGRGALQAAAGVPFARRCACNGRRLRAHQPRACAGARQVWRTPGLGKSVAPMQLHRTYGGCHADIAALAWSADSAWVAVASKDLTARRAPGMHILLFGAYFVQHQGHVAAPTPACTRRLPLEEVAAETSEATECVWDCRPGSRPGLPAGWLGRLRTTPI